MKARASQLAATLVATFERRLAKAAEIAARKGRSIGGLLRKYFPGLVNLPTGGRDVAWS